MQEETNASGCFTGLLQSLHLRTARQNVQSTTVPPAAPQSHSHKGCELPVSLVSTLPESTLSQTHSSFVSVHQPDYEHVADTCCDWGRDVKFSALPPSYVSGDANIYKPEVLATIESELDKLDPALHKLNLSIHGMCEPTPPPDYFAYFPFPR